MAKVKETKVIIAAGGTGGHIYPGIAIAEEMKRQRPEAKILFAGTERGLEAKILPPLGWRLCFIKSTSIKDRSGIGKAMAYAQLPLSVLRAARLMMREAPAMLVSIGGYAAGPLSIAAWALKIPFVLVEPNAIAGLTNRKIGKFARRAFVAFDEAQRYFPKDRVVVSGNPVRKEILSVANEEGPGHGKMTFFVFGGSQGALRLNSAVVEALPELSDIKDRFRVIHQTGARQDHGSIEGAYRSAGVEARVFGFTDRIWDCYREADVVMARSGATTVAELCALRIPSLLVPYPYAADDHQRANALGMTKTGGAIMILDSDFTAERVASEIRSFVERPTRIEAMRAALVRLNRIDAAKEIVDECLKMLEGECE